VVVKGDRSAHNSRPGGDQGRGSRRDERDPPAVIALGGFSGTDPAPTLAQFPGLVASGAVHDLVGDASSASITASGGGGEAARIVAWVTSQFRPVTVGGTVHDLTAPVLTS
jgi:hypothetical protein